jgi:hypothetical protein
MAMPIPQIRERIDLKQGECATLGMMHEFAVGRAVKAFEDGRQREPYMTPFLWLLRYPGELATIETRWGNDVEKDVASKSLRLLMKITNCTAYSFITEAWMASFSKAQGNMPEHPINSVRGLPADQREDVLMISTFDRSTNYHMTRFGIKRANTPHAKLLVRDDWIERGPDMHMEGRMWNLLL